MMQTIAFFLVFLGTFPGIIAQQCAGDYTTCCPAYDKKQVTISTKSYIVQCDKVIGPKTPVKAATPKACVDLCQGDSECVNAYWQELAAGAGGLCIMSSLTTNPKSRKVALLPVIPDPAAIAAAVTAAELAKDLQCNKTTVPDCSQVIATKDNQCRDEKATLAQTKDAECQTKINASKGTGKCITPWDICGEPFEVYQQSGTRWAHWKNCQANGKSLPLSGRDRPADRAGNVSDCIKLCLRDPACVVARVDYNDNGKCHIIAGTPYRMEPAVYTDPTNPNRMMRSLLLKL